MTVQNLILGVYLLVYILKEVMVIPKTVLSFTLSTYLIKSFRHNIMIYKCWLFDYQISTKPWKTYWYVLLRNTYTCNGPKIPITCLHLIFLQVFLYCQCSSSNSNQIEKKFG